jgi:hypothetical protein
MRKFISGVIVISIVMIGLTSAAAADPPATATGTQAPNITLTTCHNADGNTYCNFVATVIYAGDLAGTGSDNGHSVFHSDGSITFEGKEVGTGTFFGTAGGWTGNFWGSVDPSGAATGGSSYTGTDGLTGLHLHSCPNAPAAPPTTYCFIYHWGG